MKCGGLPWCDPGGCSVAVLRFCVWIYASRRSTTQVMIVSAPHFLPLSSLSHCSSSRQILLTRNKMENTHIAQGMSVDRGASSAGTMNTAERNRTHEKIVRNVFISVNFLDVWLFGLLAWPAMLQDLGEVETPLPVLCVHLAGALDGTRQVKPL